LCQLSEVVSQNFNLIIIKVSGSLVQDLNDFLLIGTCHLALVEAFDPFGDVLKLRLSYGLLANQRRTIVHESMLELMKTHPNSLRQHCHLD